jgi:hypothetical protein
MHLLPYAVGGLVGGTLLKSLFKSPKPPPAAQPVTRNDAMTAAERQDALLRRRGGAADIVTGAYGAEPGPGSVGKTVLGS